jgi:hypothetical protein
MAQELVLFHDTPIFAPNSPQNESSFDLAVAADDFDNSIFEDEECNQDDDEISLGSEDGDGDLECDVEGEENIEDEGISWEPSDTGDEDENVLYGSPSRPHNDDEGFHSYTWNELRLLKQVDVDLPSVPNAKDISRTHKAVCNSAFVPWEGNNKSENLQIERGMVFDTLQELQFFLADYAIRYHRPFTVVHSDKNLRYDIMCKQGCRWRVWSRVTKNTGKWRITRVLQPHTCSLAKPKKLHAQCTPFRNAMSTLWISGTRQELPLKPAKCWIKLHMNTLRLLN